jgi:acid phosphatase
MKRPAGSIAIVATTATAASLLFACTAQPVPGNDAAAHLDKIQNIVVIYAENRSFDQMFGHFLGARGLNEVIDAHGQPLPRYARQRDRDGSVLPVLPPTWGGVTASGQTPVVTQADSANLPNAPFSIQSAFRAVSGVTLSTATVTRDLYHRFFENQMQIGDGTNDAFAAWSDAGGLTMGYFDYSASGLYRLAEQYTLADQFFQGAYGGSFLNHLYLVCACAPEYPHADAPASGAHPTIAVLDKDARGRYLPRLATAATSPRSALDGPPTYVLSGNIAPLDYFGDGKFYAVNTMQPPYQPSGNPPIDGNAANLPYAAPTNNTTMPPLTEENIGDLLSAAHIDWAWYAGAWNAAIADGQQDPKATRSVIYAPRVPRGSPNFQPHHMPFNYFANMDPVTHAADRTQHLRDYADLLADAAAGKLPPVAFYKPQGNLNQHEGYTNLDDGDEHIAALVAKLQASPQWPNMVIVVTYDENGGVWDHATPPKGDLLGPGTRVPTVIISPLAKRHFVDHTPYDTGSILRLIAHRYRLPPLRGTTARDGALAEHHERRLGDLTNALDL